jgi:Mlc titration factor MtfA (ptsG expression regulator)
MPIAILLAVVALGAWMLFGPGGERPAKHMRADQRAFLEKYFTFYARLDTRQRARFERIVMAFLGEKRWTGIGIQVGDEIKMMISASAAQLLFGLPDLTLMHFEHILVYDDAYRSRRSGRRHQGEVNPHAGIIRLSWAHYLQGYGDPYDAHNVALHELAHALWFEDVVPNADDDFFDPQELERWKSLAGPCITDIRAGRPVLFRSYAGTNEAEFFAVAVEYFFEQAEAFHHQHPELYATLVALLRQDPLSPSVTPSR